MADPERDDLPEATKGQDRTTGGRSPNPAYELFVLSELMSGPTYGYKLHDIIRRILGPFHRLSWGTLYPLIRKLERQGLIISEVERQRDSMLQEERRQPRKQYRITESGQVRFFALMLDPGEYNSDYPDLFAVKFIRFGLLTPAQRLIVLQQYREFLTTLQDHYQKGSQRVVQNAGISEHERPYILRFADYRTRTLEEELAWLDRQIEETR